MRRSAMRSPPRISSVLSQTMGLGQTHLLLGHRYAAATAQLDDGNVITWHDGTVSREQREAIVNQTGCTIWFTGLSASGKSTITAALEQELAAEGRLSYRLDGDNVRMGLNKGLTLSDEDRTENVRRVGEVCRLFADAGVICLASFIAPFQVDRDAVRSRHEEVGIPFVEVHVHVSTAEALRRDPKGLYAKALAGKISGMTGVDAPYEVPENCELSLDTDSMSLQDSVSTVYNHMKKARLLGPPRYSSGLPPNQRTIMLWTAPRCISTAFERAIIERNDCRVLHEPFSRAYYYGPEARSTRYDTEQRRDDTFQSVAQEVYHCHDDEEVSPVFSSEGSGPVFAKDMAYYVHGLDHELTTPMGEQYQHTFLLRHPAKAIRSLYMKSCVDNEATGWDSFDEEEAGFKAMHCLWKRAQSADSSAQVVVVDADDMLLQPEQMLEAYCKATGLASRELLLSSDQRATAN